MIVLALAGALGAVMRGEAPAVDTNEYPVRYERSATD